MDQLFIKLGHDREEMASNHGLILGIVRGFSRKRLSVDGARRCVTA